jgi:hypothetical protein
VFVSDRKLYCKCQKKTLLYGNLIGPQVSSPVRSGRVKCSGLCAMSKSATVNWASFANRYVGPGT